MEFSEHTQLLWSWLPFSVIFCINQMVKAGSGNSQESNCQAAQGSATSYLSNYNRGFVFWLYTIFWALFCLIERKEREEPQKKEALARLLVLLLCKTENKALEPKYTFCREAVPEEFSICQHLSVRFGMWQKRGIQSSRKKSTVIFLHFWNVWVCN